ncbi:MAG TPA: alpha-L-fucosidase [Chitinophagaceae bacterium]|nr:alpha-L-fucosidase [Chitinophagaceae bacterium]
MYKIVTIADIINGVPILAEQVSDMKKSFLLTLFFSTIAVSLIAQHNYINEPVFDKDKRMHWWREARFGMFIHWGLYSVPAGEWKGSTNHAEWIRTTAQIPLKEYDQFLSRFNPVHFDAEAWVQMAKDAGMKYITITSKHHDGFCLWDSKETDFDVMSTPFKRDILKELADACRKIGGVKLCFYHSIMDWHHPDYNQRREWEKDRPTEGTDRNRYISYLKNQLKELVTNYGDIGVLWFDGEWENFWTHEDGKDLYNYVRSLKPDIIINNRVDKGRGGMAGMTSEGDFGGDFGTPEQEIPETGLPGVDWESCMTMNNNWGFNKADKNFKSTKDLIRNLVDIASKGGNFLLNIGPKADGTFPQESIDRLKAIGDWMKVNGESIYGTSASPFDHIEWGRVTQKQSGTKTKLYLHVFAWPKDDMLQLNGIANKPLHIYELANNKELRFDKKDNTIYIHLPSSAANDINTVIVLEIEGKPLVYKPPVITANTNVFIDHLKVSISLPGEANGASIRYTINGSDPVSSSSLYKGEITLTETTTIRAASFDKNKKVSGIVEKKFEKVEPWTSIDLFKSEPGLNTNYYQGEWDKLPDFKSLTVKETGISDQINPGKYLSQEKYGVVLQGFIQIPSTGMYSFYLSSDDGSTLYIDENKVIDNDGLHGMIEKKGVAPLAAGFHDIRVEFFEKTGGDDLKLFIEGGKIKKQEVPAKMLFH